MSILLQNAQAASSNTHEEQSAAKPIDNPMNLRQIFAEMTPRKRSSSGSRLPNDDYPLDLFYGGQRTDCNPPKPVDQHARTNVCFGHWLRHGPATGMVKVFGCLRAYENRPSTNPR